MHEGAIVFSLLQSAAKIKQQEHLQSIKSIHIAVGKMHHIIPDFMQSNFKFMKTEFAGFEHAVLKITEKEIKIKCPNCQYEFNLDQVNFLCPSCQGGDTEIIQGNELHIISIEGTEA